MPDFHSITFGKRNSDGSISITANTWQHLHLIPSSRPIVAQPKRTFKYVDIPGRDGSLDLTTYLSGTTGKIPLSDRSGTWEFFVIQEYDGEIVDSSDWVARKAQLDSLFDGRIYDVCLDDDSTHYYTGRITLESYQPGQAFSSVQLSYRFGPYKYLLSTGEADGI